MTLTVADFTNTVANLPRSNRPWWLLPGAGFAALVVWNLLERVPLRGIASNPFNPQGYAVLLDQATGHLYEYASAGLPDHLVFAHLPRDAIQTILKRRSRLLGPPAALLRQPVPW